MKSWEIMTWAFTTAVGPKDDPPALIAELRKRNHATPTEAARRLVLVAYAWRAGVKLVAWPGLDQLERDTGLYRETISVARFVLVARGALIDTKQRVGKRGQGGRGAAVYRLGINARQMPQIAPVDNARDEAANTAESHEAMSGNPAPNERQSTRVDTRQMPQGTSSVNISTEHVHGARAREEVPGGNAAELPEQVPRIVEGLEHPIEKLKRDLPHLFKNAPPAAAAEDPT